jgi:hypothetical protein
MNYSRIKNNKTIALQTFVLFYTMVLISVTLGFGFTSSIVFAAFLLINAAAGAYVYLLINQRLKTNLIELLGVGIGLGTIIPAIINFAAMYIGFPFEYSAPVFPLFVVLMHLFSKYRVLEFEPIITPAKSLDLLLVSIVPLFALASWSAFLSLSILVGLCIVIPTVSFGLSRWKPQISIPDILFAYIFPVFLTSIIAYRYIFDIQLIWKTLLGVDVAFDESTSYGMAAFGANGNALNANSITRGHVLTHAWAGDFSSFLSLPRFMVTGSLGFLVGLVGIAAVVFSISIKLFNNSQAARITLLLITLQASLPEEYFIFNTMRMAHAMSAMWLFLFVFLVIQLGENISFRRIIFLSVLLAGVTVGKVHWGVIGLMLALVISTARYITSRKLSHILFGVIASFFFLGSYFWFVNLGYSIPMRFQFSWNFTFEVFALFVLRFLLFVPLLFVNKSSIEWLICAVSCFIAFTLHGALAGDFASDYWLSFALIWSSIFMGGFLQKNTNLFLRKLPLAILVIVGMATGIWTSWYFFANNYYFILTGENSVRSFLIVSYPELISIFAVFFLLLIVSLIYLAFNLFVFRCIRSGGKIAIFSIIAISLNFGIWISQTQRVKVLEHYYDISLSSTYLFDVDQVQVGEWLERNSDKSDLIASGQFCFKPIANTEPFPQSRENDCLNRFMLTWITALAHRPVLVTPPVYSPTYVGDASMIRDYNQSIYFGRFPNLYSEHYLFSRGVKYFIIDKQNMTNRDFLDSTNIVFENGTYIVVRLIERFSINA